jgi:quercetin dioxygenase-like cupin family protein
MSNRLKENALRKTGNTYETMQSYRLQPQELNRLKLSALALTDTLHAPGSRIPAHTHDAPSICLTITGPGLEIVGGSRINTQPGGVILRAPKIIHSNQFGAVPHRSFMIELEEKWLETCRHFLRLFEGHRHFPGGPVSALALRIYRESRIKDSVAPIIVEGLMLEMLGPRAATAVLNGFVRGVKSRALIREVTFQMTGKQRLIRDPATGVFYRLFEKAIVNSNGSFYQLRLDPTRKSPSDVGSFAPGTRRARVLILLHELGHLIPGENGTWLIPDDGYDARQSDANTLRVQHACLAQLKELK